jgi:hypothetical protein
MFYPKWAGRPVEENRMIYYKQIGGFIILIVGKMGFLKIIAIFFIVLLVIYLITQIITAGVLIGTRKTKNFLRRRKDL